MRDTRSRAHGTLAGRGSERSDALLRSPRQAPDKRVRPNGMLRSLCPVSAKMAFATAGGTWRQIGDGAGAWGWHPVRQAFVGPEEPLRLGDHRCSASDLLRQRAGAPFATAAGGAWDDPGRSRVRGPAVRDPATGEIVRRRP